MDLRSASRPPSTCALSTWTCSNQWRDDVVRKGEREYVSSSNGKIFDMSLSRTCMDCHSNKAEFCDACHTYMAVSPYCWDCHVEPKGAN